MPRNQQCKVQNMLGLGRRKEEKQYWCMFCSFRAWFEVTGEEFKTCPRCGNGMFVWEKDGEL